MRAKIRLGKAQHFADVAHRRAAAISDDVGGHGGAQLAVALVDVLDGALALIAAGQIEIDVRPLAALFGKKALEEQFHVHRIDGRDAERIADRAVGGRSAALHQNVLAPAEVDDVPDDQEIAGQIEFFDERELAIDLAAGAAAQIDGFASDSDSSRLLRRACAGTNSSFRPAEWDSGGIDSRDRRA